MTTTWEIRDTRSTITDGLITKILYGCVIELEDDIERKIGEITLTGDSTSSNFVPFETLTEETLIEWVKSSLGEEQVIAIETEIQNNINARIAIRKAVTEKGGLPWR